MEEKLLKLIGISSLNRKRIEYLEKMLIPHNLFPFIQIESSWSLSAQADNHTIYMPSGYTSIIDDIFLNKEKTVFKIGWPTETSFVMSTECADMIMRYFVLHEAGHIYYRDLRPHIKSEKRADDFATQTLESIIGGFLCNRMEDYNLVESYKKLGGGDMTAHSSRLYYDLYPRSHHPSHKERTDFFKTTLIEFLKYNPSLHRRYEKIRELVKKIYVEKQDQDNPMLYEELPVIS